MVHSAQFNVEWFNLVGWYKAREQAIYNDGEEPYVA